MPRPFRPRTDVHPRFRGHRDQRRGAHSDPPADRAAGHAPPRLARRPVAVPLDLHVHSTFSDGTFAPEDLVAHASALGLDALAIADHDCVDGVPAALDAASEHGLLLVPAVELSCSWRGHDVHVLGYFVDHTDAAFRRRLDLLRDARRERAARIVSSLEHAGYDVSLDEVMRLAEDGSVGRTHVARALLERGHVGTVAEAFERFLARDRPFYVPKAETEPAEAVATILAGRGLPVLAHPGVTRVDDLIPDLVAAGLRGLEAYHGDHTPQDRTRYAAMAAAGGLLVTGGSDYHGPGFPNPPMGETHVPDEVLPALLAAAGLA
ncbi:MAG: hypothetical protein C0418_02905 [Coriobacteriaceae bacterium]|nr:hypothetical protein [Coriobacteriaceae bacterium]